MSWTELAERKDIQLCYPFSEKRLLTWKPPYIVQPKLNGDRCRLEFNSYGELPMFKSSTARLVTSLPHLDEIARDLKGHSKYMDWVDREELDGEFYRHGMPHDGEDGIRSIVSRTVNFHPLFHKIQFHVFDHVDESIMQGSRLIKLADIMSEIESDLIVKVETHIVNSFDEVMYWYEDFLARGYEGIIVRNAWSQYIRRHSIYVMKFKPKKSDNYKVIGCYEEISKDGIPKARLGGVICEGIQGQTFNVGSGFNAPAREKLWKNRDIFQRGDISILVEYQNTSQKRKVPVFGVLGTLYMGEEIIAKKGQIV